MSSWREAFVRQAKSDFTIFRLLNTDNAPVCHQLHYLQMAAEKIAKALRCAPDNTPPRATHEALVVFLRTIKKRADIARSLGFTKKKAFERYIESIIPFASIIEGLAPEKILTKPNPEYPWLLTDHDVVAPVDFGFENFTRNKDRFGKFIKLLGSLIDFGIR